ncbi:PREDICTED: sorting nexin-2-like isoform X1 [Branchiostoma belcheri]|uniref:Sorting nexin-2-like isoform X1 n=1 Tax=Branchiostoma belcheri TaxID=7741 RepID=A0A6P4ZB84_BRABE|nr:PREDICTED: sorting nexin-2-like isoform X1 [Branchiostoma belcheri]
MADDREPPPLFDDEKPDKKEDEDDLFATPNEAPKEEVKDEPASLPTEPAQDKSEDLFAADDDLFGEKQEGVKEVDTSKLLRKLTEDVDDLSPVEEPKPLIPTAADSGKAPQSDTSGKKESPKEKAKEEDSQAKEPKPKEVPASMAKDQSPLKPMKVSVDLHAPKPAQNMQEDSADSPKLEVTDEPPPEMDISGEGEEVDLDSPETEGPSSPAKMEPDSDSSPLEAPPMAEVLPPAKPVPEEKPKPTPAPRKPSMEKSKEEIEEEESGDQFTLDIKVHDPGKVGDGMGAYMSYKVTTQTSIPAFRRPSMTVTRRFSDFLGLHEKLSQKHVHVGRIVPPAPEKSVVGMTKIKMSKEDTSSTEFVEKRRALLERFLQRISIHPVLQMDPDFRDFLEQDELPRATSTSAVSGAGVLRLIKGVGDTLSKVTIKMDESDQWFEEKQNQVEALDQQLKKLHASVEALVTYRKELGISTAAFAKSTAMLSNSEEHTALSRALSQLAEVEEKIEQVHLEQADNDFFLLSELLKDYIGIIQSIRVVFHERVKSFHNWQNAQQNLAKKREQEAKFKQTGKTDKIAQAQEEIREWEGKVEKGREDFEEISKTIRTEIRRFETNRVKDFRNIIIKYMETLMNSQQQLIKYWEGFLPEAKAIA